MHISGALTFNGQFARTGLRLAVGLMIGAVACGFAGQGISPAHLAATLAMVSPGWLVAALVGVLAVAATKAARWRRLFPHPRPLAGQTFWTLVTAQMLNLLIPVRIGELVRLGLMKQQRQPVAVTLSTLVVEKTVDLLAAGLIAALLLPALAAPGWLAQTAGGLLLVGGGLTAGLVTLWLLRQPLLAGLTRRQWLPKPAIAFAHTGLTALSSVTRGPDIAALVGWTALAWLLSLLAMLALLAAFQLQLPPAAAILLMLAVSVSNITPAPPALIGLMQAAAIVALSPFGVPKTEALAVGIALNAVTILPLILFGSWHLARIGWNFTPGD